MKEILKIIVLVVILIIFCIRLHQTNQKKYIDYTFEKHTIQRGETSWNIAVKNVPVGMDIRQYIYYMEEDNNIEAGNIYPGMILIIRIYKEVGDMMND